MSKENGLEIINSIRFDTEVERTLALEDYEGGHFTEADLNPPRLIQRMRMRMVAFHEIGHKKLVSAFGYALKAISVIPRGITLGYTSYATTNEDPETAAEHGIALALGSVAAQERVGLNPWEGTGSDYPKAKRLSEGLSELTGGLVHASEYFSRGLSLAKACLASIPISQLKVEARSLEQAGTVA
ncbi:hypothetical protein HYS91_05315 [Candidatus Daviesbacteria bacterium]|nr:hypothetical protein [Candidatus Daviesbacteria bacterium]